MQCNLTYLPKNLTSYVDHHCLQFPAGFQNFKQIIPVCFNFQAGTENFKFFQIFDKFQLLLYLFCLIASKRSCEQKMILHELFHPIVRFSEPFLVLNGKSRKRAGAPIFLLLSVPATNKSTIRLKSFFTSSVKLSLLQLL